MLTPKWTARPALAFAFAALLVSAPNAVAQKSNDTLRVGFSFPFEVIDPYFSGLREVKLVIGEMVFDTLVGRDPKTFESVPLLATAWNWVDDVTLDMDLRQGVKWHDGVEFTSDDVEYTFDYLNDPKSKVPRKEWFDWVETVEKMGPHKVRLHLSRPFGPALAFMSQVLPIMPKDFYGEGGVAGGNGRLVGTGPYKIVDFVHQKEVLLEVNKDYFEGGPKGTPSIGNVLIRNLPDEATVLAELLSGGIDWMWRVAPEHTDRLAASPGISITNGGTMRIFWIGFDAMGQDPESPFKDVRVRRAVAHAIDRAKMAKELVGPGSAVVHVMCYPTQVGCPDQSTVAQYDFNPEKARELLAEGRISRWILDHHLDLCPRPQSGLPRIDPGLHARCGRQVRSPGHALLLRVLRCGGRGQGADRPWSPTASTTSTTSRFSSRPPSPAAAATRSGTSRS